MQQIKCARWSSCVKVQQDTVHESVYQENFIPCLSFVSENLMQQETRGSIMNIIFLKLFL